MDASSSLTLTNYHSFKEERKVVSRLARAIVRKYEEKTDYVSCRGVECTMLTKKRTMARIERQRQALDAVLDEQLKQWEKGTNSSEVIALHYQRVTRPCQEYSHKLAMEYWNESQEPIKDDDKESDIRSQYPMFAAKKKTSSSTAHQAMAHLQPKVRAMMPPMALLRISL
jgi:hypothetical protein